MSAFSEDMAVKAAWGIRLPDWNRLSPKDRADLRDRVSEAPYLNQENQ